MKTMTPQQLARVETILKKGKARYVILHGVFGWGLLTAILFIIFTHFTKNQITRSDIIIPFVLFPIGGIFWGLSMWYYFKRRFETQSHNPK